MLLLSAWNDDIIMPEWAHQKIKTQKLIDYFYERTRANEQEIEIQDRDGEWESMSMTTANHTINEHRHRYVYSYSLFCAAQQIHSKHQQSSPQRWRTHTLTQCGSHERCVQCQITDTRPYASVRRTGGRGQLWWWRQRRLRSYAPMEYLWTTNERCSKYETWKGREKKLRCVYWKYPRLAAWPKPRWAHTKFESIRLRTCSRLS